jgi:hypothetical protein
LVRTQPRTTIFLPSAARERMSLMRIVSMIRQYSRFRCRESKVGVARGIA